MVLAKWCSRIGGRRYSADLHLRMGQQQPEQFSARITCRASYGDPYSHPHDYAIDDKVMHIHVSQGVMRLHLGVLIHRPRLAGELPRIGAVAFASACSAPVILTSDPMDLGVLADHAEQSILVSTT